MSFARRMMITAHHSRVAQRVHSAVGKLAVLRNTFTMV